MPRNALLDLKPKYRTFVRAYLDTLNQTAAAIASGTPERSAAETGKRLIRRPEIKAAIAQLADDRDRASLVTRDKVAAELAAIAFADMGDFVDVTIVPNGKQKGEITAIVTPKRLDEMPAECRHAIRELSYDPRTGKVTLKLYDKPAALAQLARMGGMNRDQQLHVHTADFGALERARDRASKAVDKPEPIDVTPEKADKA